MAKDEVGKIIAATDGMSERRLYFLAKTALRLADDDEGSRDFDANLEYILEKSLLPVQGYKPTDFTIEVDRSVAPDYGFYSGKLLYPEYEQSGPVVYDLNSDVMLWRHRDQRPWLGVSGTTILEQLRSADALKSCLNLQDGHAIIRKGISAYYTLFGNRRLVLWKSVVQMTQTRVYYVPHVIDEENKLRIAWDPVFDARGLLDPAPRFLI